MSSQNSYSKWEENYNKGVEALKKEDYDKASQFLDKAYIIANNNFTKNDKNLYNTLYQLGLAYKKSRNPKKALTYFEEAVEHAKKAKIDTLLIEGLKETSSTHLILGNNNNALNILKSRQKLIINTFGGQSLKNSENFLLLSSLYIKTNNFDLAIEANQSSTSILESIYGYSSVKLVSNISQLGQIYGNLGNYDKALKLQDKALSLFSDEEKTSYDYVLALFIKAWLLEKINEKEIAINLYKEVQNILKDPNHPGYIAANGNIGQASTDLGDYETGLTYIQEALKKTSPDNLRSYTTRMQNLAFLYAKLGDFNKAEKNYNKAKNNLIDHKDSNPILYGRLINNMGKMYRFKGDLNKSESLFKEALDVFLTVYDKNHIQYGYQLNDYANVLFNLERHEEALELFKENIYLSETNNRTDTQEYQNWLFNLGDSYNKLKRFNEALPLIITASNNTKTILGEDDLIYGQMLNSLAHTYIGLGDTEKAIPKIEISNSIFINEIEKVFRFRSEKEKRDFMMVIKDNFDELLSLHFVTGVNSDKLNSINLNNQLLLKGLLLNSSKGILPQLRSLNNDTINSKIQTYNYLRSLLTKTLNKPVINRNFDTDSLKDIVNNKEAELTKLNSSYFGNTYNLKKDWKLSKNVLTNNEVALEFANYNLIKQDESTDSIMYVAFLYKKNWGYPKMIPLFEEADLKTLLKGKSPNQIYVNKPLYQLIFKDIEPYINNIETIFYAPSGILNQLSLSALFNNFNNTTTNNNNINLFQLSNTGVLKQKSKEPEWTNTLFMGAINYDYTETSNASLNTTQYAMIENSSLKNSRGTRNRGESWTYLPGTLKEIQSLKNILTTYNKPYLILKGNEATEARFKSLSGNSPKILHIATHGYFYENNLQKPSYAFGLSTEDRYRLSDDPLLRSGLILTGANYAWKHGANPNDKEDGILTAMEISNLDLSNTDIVILSACETGLGDINGSEGVYGLQRAFKMAGVDIIVMSLWQVPDFETAEFMELFYNEWINIGNVKEAFNNTQKIMQQKYMDTPKKWAAFVLFE
jgi:CHAT domain-containing protein/uncharacterized protein HemY